MSRGLEAEGRDGRRDAAPRELRIPGRLAGRRGLASAPRSGAGGQRGQLCKDPPPPRPPGEGETPLRPPGLRTPIQPEARPATATSSARHGSPASWRRPAGHPTAAPGRMGKDEAEGPPVPRLPGTRQRVKGGPRDAPRPSGPAPRAAIAPTPAWTPAPASRVQAAAERPAPHLISRRVCAAAPGTNQCSSLAVGRDAGAAAPHTIPARPLLRASRSPLGILPREPPYYGATKLRSLPSPPLFSTSFAPSLAPSLPPISSSPSAA